MFPIFEQGSGKGIGHGLDSFLHRFEAICADHLASRRAKAFAFIFYDFTDQALKKILTDHGVFARLDRLSGDKLSVFYLHTGSRAAIEKFNTRFLSVLGVERQATPPCVVFFRVNESQIEDIEIAQLDNADLIHGFNELYEAISSYVSLPPHAARTPSTALRWLKSSGKFIGLELFRAALKKGMELLPYP